MRILVTGGCGFIGSHVVDALVTAGHDVWVLDGLVRQAHPWFREWKPTGNNDLPPTWNSALPEDRLLYAGSESHQDIGVVLRSSLTRTPPEVVIHLAARVGVGQSQYQGPLYYRDNVVDTALLLETLREDVFRTALKRIVVASSMSVYGEGASVNGYPIPTTEGHPTRPTSIYAHTKLVQEQMVHLWGVTNWKQTIALRFFNTYGPRQTLVNPYTGVVAIFLNRARNNLPLVVYEDGSQMRSFCYVTDVASAVARVGDCMSYTDMDYTMNVCGGHVSILDLARRISSNVQITSSIRFGDVKHCIGDSSSINRWVSWVPKIGLDEGLRLTKDWAEKQPLAPDEFDRAQQELRDNRLVVEGTRV